MQIIKGSIKHPHSVVVAMLLCGIFGYLALIALPVQMKPTLDKPEISINTTFRGASPAEVEEQITNRIEDQMDAVEGVYKITSNSQDGYSSITLEFDWGIDKDVAIIDVVNKLSQVPDLPDDADEPEVIAVSSDQQEPIMWFGMTGDKGANEKFEIAEDLVEPRIRRLEGVGDLFLFGGEEREFQILVDPFALAGRGISYNEFAEAIRAENQNVRGGFLDQGKRRYIVRTVGKYKNPEELLATIVAYDKDGGPVYLKEVASVQKGYKKTRSVVRTNGKPIVIFGVIRKTGANVVSTCRTVEEEIKKLNKEFEQKRLGVSFEVFHTQVDYIDEAIDLVKSNMYVGALLAVAVLLIFLRSSRSVLVIALSIPISIVTVFILLKFFNRSLNIISLAGLAFSVGLVMDNAIVVLENIFRHRSMNKNSSDASYDGATEVWGAILVSTLTTLAVFIPVVFIQQEAGQLFKDIAIAVSCAIGLSFIASLTIIPMAASILYRGRDINKKEKHIPGLHNVSVVIGNIGTFMAKGYDKVMSGLIGRENNKILKKVIIVAVIFIGFLASMKMLPDAEYLPSGNQNFIIIYAKPLVGTNFDKQVESILPLENQLQQMKEEGRVEMFFSVFSNRFSAVGVAADKNHASEKEMAALVGELFGRTRNITGFESLFPFQASIFRDPGKQFEVEISGPDLDRLKETSERITGQLMGMKDAVKFVRSSFQEGAPELNVRLNRDKCARVGLRVSDVAEAVESLVAGKQVGYYDEGGKDIDLSILAGPGFVETKESLAALSLITPSGYMVKLGDIADVKVELGPTAISHLEKERSIILTVDLVPEISLEKAINRVENEVLAPTRATLSGSYTLGFGGSADKLNSTLKALSGSFILALIIVYLLMVALFESFTYPLIIMATVPPAASGAFLGISISHKISGGFVGFDVLAMLGLVILAGVVVNNAVLIVHQALNFRREGYDPDEALIKSCSSRLRPIAMSMTTSVFGMLPLAMGGGAGSELYRSLGAAVVGGLAVSTIFTLFLVPSLLSLVQDIQWYLGGKKWKTTEED